MKILVTNDDGIYARGLWLLVKSLKKIGEVVVVAPDREQSAVGTSLTLHVPLRVNRVNRRMVGVETYSVEGTPADSVILALGMLIPDGVDLVVSGINEGANLGDDVLISGTVGAALQGYLRGFPAIALSVAAIENVHFDVATRIGALLAEKVAAKALPNDLLLNVNLPNLPLEKIEGIEVTKLGRRSYGEHVDEGYDGKRKYYWIVRGKPEWSVEEGTDIWAIRQKRISITQLQGDLRGEMRLPMLKDLSTALFEELRC